MSLYNVYKNELIKKPIIWGLIASSSLFLVYLLILTVANSLEHGFQQFTELWYWMIPLIIGFGMQVSLFVYVKQYGKVSVKSAVAGSTVVAAGSISATSMIACCAHHVTDIIPILGLTAATIFLAEYQIMFLIIGIISNFLGITIMLKLIQDHKLFVQKSLLGKLMKINMKKVLYINLLIGIIVLIIMLITNILR